MYKTCAGTEMPQASKCVDKLEQQGKAALLEPSLLHPTAERGRRNKATKMPTFMPVRCPIKPTRTEGYRKLVSGPEAGPRCIRA